MIPVAVTLAGCVTAYVPDEAPVQEAPLSINIVQRGLSGFRDLPVGFHRIPDSQLVMTGHRRKGNPAVAFLLFGVVGVIMHAAAEDDQVELLVSDIEDALRLTVAPIVEETLQKNLSRAPYSDRFGRISVDAEDSDASSGPILAMDAALILSFDGEEEYRAHAVIKATLREPPGSRPVWRSRYFSTSGPPRGLFGAEGWAAENGQFLRDYATVEFERLTQVVLADVAAQYSRTESSRVMLQGQFPYLNKPLQTVGYLLAEDERFIVVHPQLHPQFAYAGVQIMEKDKVTYRGAQAGDSVHKLVVTHERD